ncbi:MAG: ribosome recycling factor [Clostridia bacterium]|nr:ribosome recycling factor [Clostridia bacterium]
MKYDSKALEARMQKTITAYENNLADIRASQANPAVLNRVTFEYYGTQTPIKDMASISVSDARTLVISPFDRSTIKAMEKAILMSDVGITPSNDGQVIRLVFPQLTEERRKALAKQVKGMGEDAKVAIRNLRRDANDEVKKAKKDGSMTEDDVSAAEKAIQDVTDKLIKTVDTITAAKEKELMAI